MRGGEARVQFWQKNSLGDHHFMSKLEDRQQMEPQAGAGQAGNERHQAAHSLKLRIRTSRPALQSAAVVVQQSHAPAAVSKKQRCVSEFGHGNCVHDWGSRSLHVMGRHEHVAASKTCARGEAKRSAQFVINGKLH
jgi:hypothetical protein